MDWIKMRTDLNEDPAILRIAEKMRERPEVVVGYCHKFWSWVSRQCHDGSVTGVTLESVENVLAMPNFLHLMCEVGWLDYIESTSGRVIVIPKFERHLSQGAKARALTAERVRNARVTKTSRSQRYEIVTREEKRREEKKEDPPKSPTGGLGPDPSFGIFWVGYPAHKRQGRQSAVRAWQRHVQDAAEVLAALTEFRETVLAKSPRCPTPTQWLSGRRWLDDRQSWSDGKSKIDVMALLKDAKVRK